MWKNLALLAILTSTTATALHVEWRRHRHDLERIPIRIHVNGTRGKSSVTRLLASVLREQGVRTVAKTTGTVPRLILPDGTEETLVRNGPPNVGELTRAIHRAAMVGAEAIVFECMAVAPELQAVAEDRIVQPSITVITNARLDHTDLQGTSREEIAAGFPVRAGGVVATADPLVARILGPRVQGSGGTVHLSSPNERVNGRTAHLICQYLEHPDNVALALAVAGLLGIPRKTATRGIRRCAPDPGRATVVDLRYGERRWRLVNLFAANDPDSTFKALDGIRSHLRLDGDADEGRPVALFASRRDRAARSSDFAPALSARQGEFARIVLWGQNTKAVARTARAHGVHPALIIDAGSMEPDALTRLLMDSLDGRRVVVGMGNILGHTQQWLEHLSPFVEGTTA